MCLGAKVSCKLPWTRNKVVSKDNGLVPDDKSGSGEPMMMEQF